MSFIKELNRRNVFRVGVAYVIVAWLLLQVSDTLVPALHLPAWFQTGVALLLILGFPLALFFAWAFELTPEGLKKEKDVERSESISHVTGRKLDFVIIATLVVTLGFFGYDKFVLDPLRDAELVQTTINAVIEPAISQNPDRSIAVLAFADLSPEADQEYFSEGISEEILNLLAKVPELRVTARTSSFSFKDQNLEIPVIAERLNVAHVLQGSVRKAGTQIRITVQLIKADDGFHLWSETYDRELENIFVIQDEIAAAVVGALKVRLIGNMPRVLETTPEAYTLYLQSRSLMFQRSTANLLKAETLLKSALEFDSSYVPAWVQLSNIYLLGVGSASWTPHEGYPLARKAAIEALRLDADNAQAHAFLSWVARAYEYDMDAARREQEIASTLAPHDREILHSAGAIAIITGDYDTAIRLMKEAVVLDPLYPFFKRILGLAYYFAGRYDQAISAVSAANVLNPERDLTRGDQLIGDAMLASGDHSGALDEFNRMSNPIARHAGRALAFQAMGDTERSRSELNAFIENGDGWDVSIAKVHAYRGELDEAFTWLERAFEERDPGLTFGMNDPFFDNLREDPRFDLLLERMGREVL